MLKINHEKLNAFGFTCADDAEVLNEVRDLVVWLYRHNKNYTKMQYGNIIDVMDFLKCFEVVED